MDAAAAAAPAPAPTAEEVGRSARVLASLAGGCYVQGIQYHQRGVVLVILRLVWLVSQGRPPLSCCLELHGSRLFVELCALFRASLLRGCGCAAAFTGNAAIAECSSVRPHLCYSVFTPCLCSHLRRPKTNQRGDAGARVRTSSPPSERRACCLSATAARPSARGPPVGSRGQRPSDGRQRAADRAVPDEHSILGRRAESGCRARAVAPQRWRAGPWRRLRRGTIAAVQRRRRRSAVARGADAPPHGGCPEP